MSGAIRKWLTCLFVSGFIVSSRLPAVATQLVSAVDSSFPSKLGGDGDSGLSIISQDGRYVLFASTANNLTLTNKFNQAQPFWFNVYLRDNVAHNTTLVSVNTNGTGGGNQNSYPAAISTNGQFVLFESSASDLVANDTNNATDVFIRDLVNNTTTLVSVSTNGGVASGGSHDPVMTPDGRCVTFVSTAADLVEGDTNNIPDVFVRDLQAGTTSWVSLGSTATNPLTWLSSSESPEITPDGRYVIFYSSATNLVPNVTTTGELYVRDLLAGTTIWASTNARAIAKSVFGSSNVVCCNFSISDDGQFVAFEACTNPVVNWATTGIILRHSLQSGLTDIIATNAYAPRLPTELVHDLSVSPDGRFIAYAAGNPATNSIYLWDASSGTSTLVSVSVDNLTPAVGFSDAPVISSNGQFVSFLSSATNLVTNALTGEFHFYVRDMLAGASQLMDVDANGLGAGVNFMAVPSMSADGSLVAFDCANILSDNRHRYRDLFLRHVATGANELISAAYPGLASQTPDGSSGISSVSVDSNGLLVAFSSDADDLVVGDTNGYPDVFVHELDSGTNILVSVNTNGNASGDGCSYEPAISGDGRFVAFSSWADDLVADDTNLDMDVFVRDLQTGVTTLVSVSTDGVSPGKGDSFLPSISADGRYVLFHSKAGNLAANSYGNITENLFLRDLQTGITYALTTSGVNLATMTPDGKYIAYVGPSGPLYVWNSQLQVRTIISPVISVSALCLSADGQKVAYLSGSVGSSASLYSVNLATKQVTTLISGGIPSTHTALGFGNDGRFLAYTLNATNAPSIQNIYLYDYQNGSNLLVSQNYNSTGAANTNSDSPAISPDGRFIAYRSSATNLVPFDDNNVPDLFVYDASNNATILVSISADGQSSASDRSLQPVFSSDSQLLFFQSRATDLISDDFNYGGDVFALNLATLPLTNTNGIGSTNAANVFYINLTSNGMFGSSPTLTWPLAAGKVYQAQFKTNLDDPVWQDLPANAIFVGGNGFVSDPIPAVGQRFYRVLMSP